jgi:isopentenyldiphosphate isomerase
MSEHFDIVDKDDHVIGRASRSEVHGNPELTHRVAHVLVFNSSGQLYLQLRAPDKDVQPGKWDTSVGGHVDVGETYEEAATREMREELGITSDTLEPLYRYRHRNDYESEMVQTYRLVWDGSIFADPAEISEGRFFTFDQIDGSDPAIFTPNFLNELRRYREWTSTGTFG